MKNFLTFSLLIAGVVSPVYAQDKDAAQAIILGAEGQEVGKANFKQGPIGTLMNIEIKGLTAGVHGFHVHTVGTCDHADHFKSASGHVNGQDKEHGFLNPKGPEKGDLPNLYVHEDGTAKLELFLPQLDIKDMIDEDGSSLMIHENPDDHLTQPIGGAGERIACGVIEQDGSE